VCEITQTNINKKKKKIDAIMEGHHPCTEDEAVNFAALAMQVSIGDFDPQRKKIDLTPFLPPAHMKNLKKLEPLVLKAHKNFVGTPSDHAKFRYVQLARSLKTFGITFFDCRQKTKRGTKSVGKRERERERERERVCVCVCVYVSERECVCVTDRNERE